MGFLSNKIWVRIFLSHPVIACVAIGQKSLETPAVSHKTSKTVLN